MATSVTLPALGESVTEGTVTRWLKKPGDQVEVDEPLLEVSTDKVDTEIPSPAAGVLSRIVVPEDETVDVGAELAQISGDGESAPAQPAAEPQQAAAPEPAPEPEPEPEPAQPQPARTETEQPAEPAQQAPSQPQPDQPAQPSGGGAAAGTEVPMPALGESVTEGTVTRWLKQVGESVEVDEPLLEVSTDKVDTEIPSPAAGTVLDIKVQQDETVDVGTVLAIVGSGSPSAQPSQPAPSQPAPSQPAPSQPAAAAPAPAQQAEPSQAAPQAQPSRPAPREQTAEPVQQTAPAAPPQVERPASTDQQPSGDGPSGYVTPLVRKLAAEHDIDLASLSGTGVGGRIRKQDVLDAAEAKKQAAAKPAAPAATAPAAPKAAPSPLRGRTEKLSRMRQIIAQRMVESLQTAAQLTTVIEVDVTRIAQLRARAKDEFLARHGVKLSFLPFFALAAVEALRQHPKLNASIDTEQKTVTYHDTENLAIAVDTERGLIVPVIHNAGDLNLAGLARHIGDLADRTRSNTVGPDDLVGGTFTLTNTGGRGVLFDTPIFPQPQVAMLGTGAVVKRAVVVDDANLGEIIVPRSMVYLSLSYDHRLVDGADAARYLATVKERLEAGDFESSLGL
jgi:2-oxoglutarate dehydrogenase E2 component (dihydrolipoamide succinyltransferase)